MGLPPRLIGETRLAGLGQAGDQGASQSAAGQIVECRVVQRVISVAGVPQVQEVQPALRGRCAEPGEAVVADLRAAKRFVGVPRVSLAYAKRIETPGQPS